MSIHMEKCPRSVHRGFKTAASSWSRSTVVLVKEMNNDNHMKFAQHDLTTGLGSPLVDIVYICVQINLAYCSGLLGRYSYQH